MRVSHVNVPGLTRKVLVITYRCPLTRAVARNAVEERILVAQAKRSHVGRRRQMTRSGVS